MDLPIKNINDLRVEIYRLKGLEHEQSLALRQRVNTPSGLFSTIFSLVPRSKGADGENNSFFNQDIVGLLSRIVLPFTLNKTVFRNSNFIVKALVGLVSQKASHFINEDTVVSIWDKIKSFLPGKHETTDHKSVTAKVKLTKNKS